jgi:hypothetical protein
LVLLTLSRPLDAESSPAQWLEAHNHVRANLRAYDGKRTSSPPLTWNATLARLAADWARRLADRSRRTSRCYLEHRPDSLYGENLFCLPLARLPKGDAQGVDFFVDRERDLFDPARSSCRHGDLKCGHYTQVISQLSRTTGCATAGFSIERTKYVIGVCNYDPPGNITIRNSPIVFEELYPRQRRRAK